MRLLSLKKQLQLVFSKATRQAFDLDKNTSFVTSKSSDYQSRIALDIYNQHKTEQFRHIQDEVTPGSLALEIKDLLGQHNKEFDVWIDSFGNFQVKAKNVLLESYMNHILDQEKFTPYMSEMYLQSHINVPQIDQQVLFPVIDIIQEISLGPYRHWIAMESIARMQETFNDKVKRVSCVSNNLPFHGLVLKYMKERPGQPANMQDIAKYLKQSEIDSEDKIVRLGREFLQNLANDEQMYQVHQSITGETFNKAQTLFDSSNKLTRLKSRELKKQTIIEIIETLCKMHTNTHISCQRHEVLALEQLRKSRNIKLTLHKIAESEPEVPMSSFFDQVSAMVESRLKQNIPGFEGKVQKYQLKWLNYYISTIPLSQHLILSPEIVTDIIFTKSDQLLSQHSKNQSMEPVAFKITCEADRKLALFCIRIMDHLFQYDLAEAHSILERYSTILRKSPTYSNFKLMEIMTGQIYKLSCVL